MKDNPKKLKTWLSSYLIISSILFYIGYLWSSYTGSNFLGIRAAKPLIISLLSLIITFFCYLKITKKPIGWSLNTILLAYFFSSLLALLITSILNSSRNSFTSYFIFRFLWVIFNTLFMFAGVYAEKKTTNKSWDDDILDDLEV